MTLRLDVITPCPFCGRPGDVTVVLEGELVYVCEICWERGEEAIEREDDDDD